MDAYGRHEIGVGSTRPHQDSDNIPMSQPYDPSKFDAFFHEKPLANGIGIQPLGQRQFNQVDSGGRAVTNQEVKNTRTAARYAPPLVTPPAPVTQDAFDRQPAPAARQFPIAPKYQAPGGPTSGSVRFDLPPDAPMTINGVTKTPETHPEAFDMNAVNAYRQSGSGVGTGVGLPTPTEKQDQAAATQPIVVAPGSATPSRLPAPLPPPQPAPAPTPARTPSPDDEERRRLAAESAPPPDYY